MTDMMSHVHWTLHNASETADPPSYRLRLGIESKRKGNGVEGKISRKLVRRRGMDAVGRGFGESSRVWGNGIASSKVGSGNLEGALAASFQPPSCETLEKSVV